MSFEPWLKLEARGLDARVVRTAEPFTDVAQVTEAYTGLVEALEALRGPRRGLVIDLRTAPGRNDPAFERAIAPLRRRMFLSHPRRALVVKTATGRLQVKRHAQQDGVEVGVFTDEDAALAYLRG